MKVYNREEKRKKW